MVPEGESSGTALKEMAFWGRVSLRGWVLEEEEGAVGDGGSGEEEAEEGLRSLEVAAAAAAATEADRGSAFAEGVFENLPS